MNVMSQKEYISLLSRHLFMDWIESFLFANHYAHWTKKHCLIFAVFQTPLKNNTDVIISNSQLPHFGIAKKADQ